MTIIDDSLPDEATLLRMENDLFTRIDATEAAQTPLMRMRHQKRRSFAGRKLMVGVLATAAVAGIAVAVVAQPVGSGSPVVMHPAGSPLPQPPPPDLFVADTGVEDEPLLSSQADWAFDVNNPIVLRDWSTAVISGKVTAVERSFVSSEGPQGRIGTTYTVEVETVYKGQNIADVISVNLPGGSVTSAEYVSAQAEILRARGIDPAQFPDPHTRDPQSMVTENWGMNPASASLIAEHQPDSWVFFLNDQDGVYWGSGFDHALSYLKDGIVYSLHPEANPAAIPESELFQK